MLFWRNDRLLKVQDYMKAGRPADTIKVHTEVIKKTVLMYSLDNSIIHTEDTESW
jgi:hypothetical protein